MGRTKQGLFRFEPRHHRVLPFSAFLKRLGRSTLFALGLVAGSLGCGMLGYHFLEHLAWIDSFLNASMILGGMGPVDEMKTSAGKIFAGCYALYSGLVVIVTAGIILAPLMHRMLHRFHAEADDKSDQD